MGSIERRQLPLSLISFFADDCVIFGRARGGEINATRNMLLLWEVASGQKVNINKTLVSFSRGVDDRRWRRLRCYFGSE